jgi:hypothetical protein
VGTSGYVMSCLELNGPLPKDPDLRSLARYWEPLGVAIRGLGACRVGSQGGARVGRQVVKSCPLVAIKAGQKGDTDWAQV